MTRPDISTLSPRTASSSGRISNRPATPIPFSASFIKSATWSSKSAACAPIPSPRGRLFEQFLAAAYTAHPYGTPTVGWPSDITGVTMTQAQKFFHEYYIPANMTVAIVGDVKGRNPRPADRALLLLHPLGAQTGRSAHRRAAAEIHPLPSSPPSRASPCISRPIIAPITAAPMTPPTTPSATSFPTAARRVSIVRWSAIRRSPPPPPASAATPATNIPASSSSSAFRPPVILPKNSPPPCTSRSIA